MTDIRNAPSLFERVVFSVPILGRMLREVVYGDKDNIYYFLVTIFTLWLVAILTLGYAAFIVPLLFVVPGMFLVLLLITVGK